MAITPDAAGQTRAPESATPASPEPRYESQQREATIEIAGGVGAPARARRWVRSCLASQSIGSEPDVALIISELVTNSVAHAEADSAQLLKITLARVNDRVRIAVTDNGSETMPHLREACDGTTGGLGLRIVDFLCLSWGVTRNGTGATEVWCDVALSQ